MPKYSVEILQTNHFIIEVLAADEDGAREEALEAIANYGNPEEEAADTWSDGFETVGCMLIEYPTDSIEQIIPYLKSRAEHNDNEAKALLKMLITI